MALANASAVQLSLSSTFLPSASEANDLTSAHSISPPVFHQKLQNEDAAPNVMRLVRSADEAPARQTKQYVPDHARHDPAHERQQANLAPQQQKHARQQHHVGQEKGRQAEEEEDERKVARVEPHMEDLGRLDRHEEDGKHQAAQQRGIHRESQTSGQHERKRSGRVGEQSEEKESERE